MHCFKSGGTQILPGNPWRGPKRQGLQTRGDGRHIRRPQDKSKRNYKEFSKHLDIALWSLSMLFRQPRMGSARQRRRTSRVEHHYCRIAIYLSHYPGRFLSPIRRGTSGSASSHRCQEAARRGRRPSSSRRPGLASQGRGAVPSGIRRDAAAAGRGGRRRARRLLKCSRQRPCVACWRYGPREAIEMLA